MSERCTAEYGGYDGMWGIYCELPAGHEGTHQDGVEQRWYVEWRELEREGCDAHPPEPHQDMICTLRNGHSGAHNWGIAYDP